MAGSVKLYQTILKCYDTTGVYSIQSNQSRPFNLRSFIFLLANVLYFVSELTYILFRANTMLEYGFSVFLGLTTANASAQFMLTISRMPNILKLIEMCESFIESSKLMMLSQMIWSEWIIWVLCFNRTAKWATHNIGQVRRIECENRTIFRTISLCLDESDRGSVHRAGICHIDDQLYLSWYGRRGISRHLLDVRNLILKNVQLNRFKSAFRPVKHLGHHSIGNRPLAMFTLAFIEWLYFCAWSLVPFQRAVYWLEIAGLPFVLLKILQMICHCWLSPADQNRINWQWRNSSAISHDFFRMRNSWVTTHSFFL